MYINVSEKFARIGEEPIWVTMDASMLVSTLSLLLGGNSEIRIPSINTFANANTFVFTQWNRP